MEKITISELKQNIIKAKMKNTDPIEKQMLNKIESAVQTCPPQFLRISKMYFTVEKIKESNNNGIR